jgi:UPF0176 protein
MADFLVAALYKFVSLPDFASKQQPLFDFCEARQVKGTLLLAEEGINGTIAGPERGVREVLAYLRQDPRMAELEHKESRADAMPFYRMKVKLKREIVTMGVPAVDAARMAGRYVKPQDWNALISDPDVVVVDVRNDYEVSIGTFARAVNPRTTTFTEFPQWIDEQKAEGGLLGRGNARVAMFCTGGIRCEKSTAYMRTLGFDEVYHLEGGVLKYLETVPESDSLWQGQCFVFDERVSVGHGLKPGDYALCRACRLPLGKQDKQSPLYEEGVSCPHCHGTHSEEQLERFRERQKQVNLAKARRQRHIGARLQARREAEGETADPS